MNQHILQFMCTSAAGRYALALFNVAKNNNSLERTLFECETVIEVLSKKSAYGSIFTRMLQGRFISINEFIKATKLQDFFVRFLQLLIKNNRMSLLKNIVRLFSHLVDNELNRESLIVYSAEEIAGSYKEKIMEKLSNSFKKNLRITYKINPNILGGLLIQSATITIDVSVRHQIDKFSKETLERLLFYGGKS